MTTRPDRSGSRIDHLDVAVPDLTAAVAFYEPTLASIGITKMLVIPADPATDFPAMTGFGLADVKPYFWLVDEGTVGSNMHLAFTVDTREEVRTFYAVPEDGDRQGIDYDADGLITADWLARETPLTEATYYLCGPKPFLASLVHGLARHGVPAERVRFEFFGPADELVEEPRQAA